MVPRSAAMAASASRFSTSAGSDALRLISLPTASRAACNLRRNSSGSIKHEYRCARTLSLRSAAVWTEVHAIVDKVRSQLELPVALDACSALGNSVVKAVPEEECSFFWANSTRPPAVQMNNVIGVERE